MSAVDDVFKALMDEAPKAFGAAWKDAKSFLPTELRKMALQLVSIAENVAKFEADDTQGYPPATGKALLEMQKRATENVLIAVTALTIIALEDTLNAVLKAAKGILGTVIDGLI
jgi:hypothetical protein